MPAGRSWSRRRALAVPVVRTFRPPASAGQTVHHLPFCLEYLKYLFLCQESAVYPVVFFAQLQDLPALGKAVLQILGCLFFVSIGTESAGAGGCFPEFFLEIAVGLSEQGGSLLVQAEPFAYVHGLFGGKFFPGYLLFRGNLLTFVFLFAGAGFSKAGKEDSGVWTMLGRMQEQWNISYRLPAVRNAEGGIIGDAVRGSAVAVAG